MNRHLKLAFLVSPFLLIGGYIIADYYQTGKEREYREARGQQYSAHELTLDRDCDPVKEKCILRGDNIVLDLFVSGGRYRLMSSQKLDDATMSLAQKDRETRGLTLSPHKGMKQWSTAVRRLSNLEMDEPLNIRMVIRTRNTQYYAEIPVNPAGPWNN